MTTQRPSNLEATFRSTVKVSTDDRYVGFTCADRVENIRRRCDANCFKSWVTISRLRKQLTSHTVSIRDQNPNGLGQLKTLGQ